MTIAALAAYIWRAGGRGGLPQHGCALTIMKLVVVVRAAPRDDKTNRDTVGNEAIEGAKQEYGAEGARQLLAWRKASHWTNFVPRIQSMMHEHGYRQPVSSSPATPPRPRTEHMLKL